MEPTVTLSPATRYTVRNGWAWAHIYVDHGMGTTGAGDPRGWVNVSVISDFGSFGYCWSHIGTGPWQDFLATVGFDYAMQKMMGAQFQVPLDLDACTAKVRDYVLTMRRENSLDRKDARLLWDAQRDCDFRDPHTFLAELDAASDGAMYRNEMWDMQWTGPNPQARGFWAEIWPHFIAQITDAKVAA